MDTGVGHALEVSRDEVDAMVRDDGVEQRFESDGVGLSVGRDAVERGNGAIEVVRGAAIGVDQRRPVCTLYSDRAVVLESAKDVLHRREVNRLD